MQWGLNHRQFPFRSEQADAFSSAFAPANPSARAAEEPLFAWGALFLALLAIAPAAAPQQSASARSEPERGYAAFYSASLEGHKTACGTAYSPGELTAAHRTLPCGTKIRVTNLRNGKTVRLTVNDRGPTSHDRIVDVSYVAAKALGSPSKAPPWSESKWFTRSQQRHHCSGGAAPLLHCAFLGIRRLGSVLTSRTCNSCVVFGSRFSMFLVCPLGPSARESP